MARMGQPGATTGQEVFQPGGKFYNPNPPRFGNAPPVDMRNAPLQPPNRQQQIRDMMAQMSQGRFGGGGNPYEKFNDRGKPIASRANLIGNQMPTYRQKLWGGMRGNPGQPRAGQPLMGG